VSKQESPRGVPGTAKLWRALIGLRQRRARLDSPWTRFLESKTREIDALWPIMSLATQIEFHDSP
jgi:hypothetical protein